MTLHLRPMTHLLRPRNLVFVLAAAFAADARGQSASALFLGNSYTYVNDLPGLVEQLALSLGDTLTTGMAAVGGYQLGNHVGDAASVAAIASQPWDFVVMQEQSQLGALPFDLTGFEAGAAALTDLIEANDECTYPVLYMTWGRQNGDAANCPSFPFMCTYAGMQQALRDNYIAVAVQNDAYAAPVGWAWKHVRDTHPGIALYQADESHPSINGSYLAACVFYCTFFRQSCVGASFTSSLPPDTAAVLQAIASATVLDSLDVWNLNVPNGTDASITGTSSGAWNEITFHHPGQGTHWWSCSNGATSTEAEPTFVFASPGIYDLTHIYQDPCGNIDTAQWTVEVIASGMQPVPLASAVQVAAGVHAITVRGARPTDLLTLHDALGRMHFSGRMEPGDRTIPCPPGPCFWRLTGPGGMLRSGAVVVR